MRRGAATSLVAIVLAVLATQHHNLHMLLIGAGLGAAGMTLLSNPVVRHAMLAMSLVAVGVTIYQFWYHQRELPARILGSASVLVTLGLLAWSVGQFGV